MQQGLDDDLYDAVSRYHEVDDFTVREKLAIQFAEQFAIDHRGIDDEFWARVAEHFSEEEMLELTMAAGYFVGTGRALQVLDIERDFDQLLTPEPD